MSDSLDLFLIDSLLHWCCFLKGKQYSYAAIYNSRDEIKYHLLPEVAKITHLAFIQQLLSGRDLVI